MDCCQVPNPKKEIPAEVDRCRMCGARGRPISRETMEALLVPEARPRLAEASYYFDRTPGCEVVYFSNEVDSYFTKRELRVRVGIKETSSPIPICYCFGHTAESAREEIARTGRTTIPDRISAEIRAGNCSCEVKNPAGICCLGEVRRAIAAIEEDLSRRAVTESERG